MPVRDSQRFSGDRDLAMRIFQVDASWYENYWLKEREPRPAGMVGRTLRAIVFCIRLARDRVASAQPAVLAASLPIKNALSFSGQWLTKGQLHVRCKTVEHHIETSSNEVWTGPTQVRTSNPMKADKMAQLTQCRPGAGRDP